MKRAIIIVLDSVGIGEMPDAAKYGDEGSNTLVNIKKARPEMDLKMCIRDSNNPAYWHREKFQKVQIYFLTCLLPIHENCRCFLRYPLESIL